MLLSKKPVDQKIKSSGYISNTAYILLLVVVVMVTFNITFLWWRNQTNKAERQTSYYRRTIPHNNSVLRFTEGRDAWIETNSVVEFFRNR